VTAPEAKVSARQRRARLALVGLFVLFFGPVVLALVLNVTAPGWVPFGRVNRGELVQPPVPVAARAIRPVAGLPFGAEGGEVAWRLVHAGPPTCDDPCAAALVKMRQARLALGKDAERLSRWWLASAAPAQAQVAAVTGEHPGLHVGIAPRDSVLLAAPPGTIQLVDPANLLVLRYDPSLDASAILKDLKRLLRISKQG
jgi:hypothetical protein